MGKEGGVRTCELWERTAAKKNTKLTWDHVTSSPELLWDHVTFSLAPTMPWTGRLLGRLANLRDEALKPVLFVPGRHGVAPPTT